ncbi:pap inositol 1,4 phosphatase [Trichuris trichiura]|uniref:3'(2'),5'-bisphosphate nucleotidase 1 n=1 Tax=Trichuris trichiura TaxID=36087 RepID=A0A077Z4V4_TRITR|nr:pap inositol 1,4 phosphatase [Trichuris trichiura]
MTAKRAWSQCCPLVKVLSSSVAIAERAGQLVRQTYGKDLKVLTKGYRDLQTEADRLSQKCIVHSLEKSFGPDLAIIAEEELDATCPTETIITDKYSDDVLSLENSIDTKLKQAKLNELVVWVDPLDGTYEFSMESLLKGYVSHVTIMIGVAMNGTPVAGVIHQPYTKENEKTNMEQGRTVWALRSAGVKGDVMLTSPPTDKLIVVTTRSHGNELLDKTLKALKPDEICKVGGAGHKALMLLEGKAHAYIFTGGGTKKWDTCAAECLLYEAGGSLTDIKGQNYVYANSVQLNNANGILALAPGANPELSKRVANIDQS